MDSKTPDAREWDSVIAARTLLGAAIEIIDTALGADYAKRNPDLLGRMAQAMMADYTKIQELNTVVHLSTRGQWMVASQAGLPN